MPFLFQSCTKFSGLWATLILGDGRHMVTFLKIVGPRQKLDLIAFHFHLKSVKIEYS